MARRNNRMGSMFMETLKEVNKDVNYDILRGPTLIGGNEFLKNTINNVFKDNGLEEIECTSIKPLNPQQLKENLNLNDEITSFDFVPSLLKFETPASKFSINVLLPYTTDNKIMIRGSNFSIHRVTSNAIINPEKDGTLIVDLVKRTFMVESKYFNLTRNGKMEFGRFEFSTLDKTTIKTKIPLLMYIFLEAGLKETFQDKIEIVHSTSKLEKGYTLFTSTNYDGMGVRIKDENLNHEMENKIMHLVYILTTFPEETLELEDWRDWNEEEEYEYWFALTCMLSSGGKPVTFNTVHITEHLRKANSLTEYKSLKQLQSIDIDVHSFAELMEYIVVNYERILLDGDKNLDGSKKMSYLDVLYSPIIESFTALTNTLVKGYKTTNIQTMFKNIKRGVMYQLISRENKTISLDERYNIFNGFHTIKENKRAFSDVPLEGLIPKGRDMYTHNLTIIPVTNPQVGTINPYGKVADGLIEFTKEMEDLERELER